MCQICEPLVSKNKPSRPSRRSFVLTARSVLAWLLGISWNGAFRFILKFFLLESIEKYRKAPQLKKHFHLQDMHLNKTRGRVAHITLWMMSTSKMQVHLEVTL